jgi:hypothetical protein
MAIYEVHGSQYELPDDLAGDKLTESLTAISQLPHTNPAPTTRKSDSYGSNKPETLAYLDETDKIAGYPAGTSRSMIQQESKFNSTAVSPAGAEGLAQIMPATKALLEKKHGRTFDSYNDTDALFMHRSLSQENMDRYKNPEDAIRAYNAGTDKSNWNNDETNNYLDIIKSGSSPTTVAAAEPQVDPLAYRPWGNIPDKVDPASLSTSRDWLSASAQLYNSENNKPFQGTDQELSDWGKDKLGWFNSNTVAMAAQAGKLAKDGSKDDKEAFLYLMETYDNTEFSWEGIGRFAKGAAVDPINWMTIETLGLGQKAATIAAKEAVKVTLMKSFGRTGILAGVVGGFMSGETNRIRQSVRIDAGAQDEFHLGEFAKDTSIGVLAGTTLGTFGDWGINKLISKFGSKVANVADNTVPPPPHVDPLDPTVTSEVGSIEDVRPIYAGLSKDHLEALHQEAVKTNQELDYFAIEKHLGTEEANRWAALSHKAKEKWWTNGDHTVELENDSAMFKGINEEEILSFIKAKQDFDISSPEALGRSIALKMSKMKDPNFENSTEQETIKSAIEFAKEQGWDIADVIKGAREKSWEYAGDDAPELFNSLFKSNKSGISAPENSTVLSLENPNTNPTTGAPESIVTTDGSVVHPNTSVDGTLDNVGRRQKNRLVEDNTVTLDTQGVPLVKLDVPEVNTGQRTTKARDIDGVEVEGHVTTAELVSNGQKIAAQLRALPTDQLHVILEQLRRGDHGFSPEQMRFVHKGVQGLAMESKVAQETLERKIAEAPDLVTATALQQKLDDITARVKPVILADDAISSLIGSSLHDRQSIMTSVESIMAGDDSLTHLQAADIFAKQMDDLEKSTAFDKITKQYDDDIAKATAAHDWKAVTQAEMLKATHTEAMLRVSLDTEGSGKLNTFFRGLNEFAISNVFTPLTVIRNLVPSATKTLIIPHLKFILSNPLEKATRVELLANYSALASAQKGAFQAAWAALKYEQSLITRDSSRMLESSAVITGKYHIGGAIRFFPRILNATDEYLAHLNYSTFVASKAAMDAVLDGTQKGLKGAALEKYWRDASAKALKESLTTPPDGLLIQPIINKGINRGFQGKQLAAYVEAEAMKNPQALRVGTNEEALSYARNVLYKERFSGEGIASTTAKGYEHLVSQSPSLKIIIGQLFFRTPIRVFEEGMRLTAGLNLFAPKFIADLKGVNGTLRQVRAKGEALTSIAIAGQVLTMYGQGKITGGGTSDYKLRAGMVETDNKPLYSIQLDDGSWWSYKGVEPLSTPIKILINGLELMDKVHIREAQGEFVDAAVSKKLEAYIGVATGSITMAIRDANLIAGLETTAKFFESLADPERSEGALLKLFSEKLSLLTPHTFTKISQSNDPTTKDPVTLFQVIEHRLGNLGLDLPDIKAPYAYDALGNIKQLADTEALFNMFSTTTKEELGRGKSTDDLYVLGELARLGRVTGQTFIPAFKRPEAGNMDLRTVLTADGKETLYDKWQNNYKKLNPSEGLLPILKSDLPDGTFKQNGIRVEAVQQVIKAYQDTAFFQMMQEEQGVLESTRNSMQQKFESQLGLNDYKGSKPAAPPPLFQQQQ